MTVFTITGSANDTNLVVDSNDATVTDSGHSVTATASATAAAQIQADLGVANAAINATAISSLQNKDVSLNELISELQGLVNTDYVSAPGAPYMSSLLATPVLGQYRTGPFKVAGTITNDAFRLTLEYYAAKHNNVKNVRYLETGYDSTKFMQKFAPSFDECVLTIPMGTTEMTKLVDASFNGAQIIMGYSIPEVDSSNIIEVCSYSQGITFMVNNLGLDSSNVLCILNFSAFWIPRGTAYNGGADPGIKANASRIVYHDYTGAVITDASGVALDLSGDNPSGPIVRMFEIAFPMDGQGFAAYGVPAAHTDCSASLDVIQGYIAAGQNVNIYIRTWGSGSINHILNQIQTRGLNNKTIANWWSLEIPDASMVGVRQIATANMVDPSSDFVEFVNNKSATYNTNSSLFSMGVLNAILLVKTLDAAGLNLTQESVLAAAKALSLTQAQISADGFGSLVAGNLTTGLQLSQLKMLTVNASGNLV